MSSPSVHRTNVSLSGVSKHRKRMEVVNYECLNGARNEGLIGPPATLQSQKRLEAIPFVRFVWLVAQVDNLCRSCIAPYSIGNVLIQNFISMRQRVRKDDEITKQKQKQ